MPVAPKPLYPYPDTGVGWLDTALKDTHRDPFSIMPATLGTMPAQEVGTIASKAGAIFNGIQQGTRGRSFMLVTDPLTKSTGMIEHAGMEPNQIYKAVVDKLAEIRSRFAPAATATEKGPTP